MRIFSPEDNESRLYWAPVVRFVITAVKEYLSKLVTLIPSWLGSEKSNSKSPSSPAASRISDNIRRRVSHGGGFSVWYSLTSSTRLTRSVSLSNRSYAQVD